MNTHDILRVASRHRVYGCVLENPGAHLRDITRRCELPLGTALYHLDYLDANGLVMTRRDGRYKRYFAAHALGRREKDLLSALRHDVPRRIMLALLDGGAATQRELADVIGVSRSTLSFHVNSLLHRELVTREDTWPERRYAATDPALARVVLVKYRASLLGEESSRYGALLDKWEQATATETPGPPARAGLA